MKTSIKVIHWLPRILCVAAMLFISMFAADALNDGNTIWEKAVAFFMHLIPTFILTAFFIVAVKWELIGGILFFLIGAGFSPFIFLHNFDMNHSVSMSLGIVMMINFPFIVVGILFMMSYYLKKKENKKKLKIV